MSTEITSGVSMPGFTWSYSQLSNFETCPKRYYHYNVAKDVTEPESEPVKQGNALHEVFRARVEKGDRLPLGYAQYEDNLGRLANAHGEIKCEQQLALTDEFKPVSWFGKGVWVRGVLDYVVIHENSHGAGVVDYKTGRMKDNPDDVDYTQLQLMALILFQHVPGLDRVKAAFWYTQANQMLQRDYYRSDSANLWGEILPRVRRVVEARRQQEYPPKPNYLCRKWCAVVSCPYHGK